MNYAEAKEHLKGNLTTFVESVTEHSKGKDMYVCPLCHSGEGIHGTGAFSIKGDKWKCFSCGESGDIFDLYGLLNGVTEYSEQLEKLCYMYNIQLDKDTQKTKNKEYTHNDIHISVYTQKEKPGAGQDYTDFFLQAHKDIGKTDYWEKRGLSLDTMNRFNVGYIEKWKNPTNPKAPLSPRLIIPTGNNSYFARDTREELTETQKDYSKLKVGETRLFNSQILQESDNTKPIYIVEGEIDAMSIIEAGGRAVGLGSVVNYRLLLKTLEEHKPNTALILALDNDRSGEETKQKLSEELKEMKVKFYCFNPYGECKDANEALTADREALEIAVARGEYTYFEELQKIKEEYQKNSVKNYIKSFVDGIKESVNTPYFPTGFPELDTILDGGFYEGLYVVGAISSLGKTTLVMQIADQVAKAGTDVMIFSLEMARAELMAKSISRHTFIEAFTKGISIRNAKTTRGITTYARYANYSKEEVNLINTAIKKYSEYAEHIYISEGIGDIGAEQVRRAVENHIFYTGKTPLVIIDYVQILAPYNERATDKQNMDKAVLELKRLSRDFKTPVIAISSLNRANYNSPISMEALKETGGLEYGSDCVIGLQLHGVGKSNFDVNEAKREDPRKIDLVILKNRNGRTGDTIRYDYYPMFNYFEEAEKEK